MEENISISNGTKINLDEISFVGKEFGYDANEWKFVKIDFHQYFRSDAVWFLKKLENKVVSAAAISPLNKKDGAIIYRLGLVATHANHQGKGFASQVISHALNTIGLDQHYICWSQHQNFYARFNFKPWGEEFYLGNQHLSHPPKNLTLTIKEGFIPEIVNFYERNSANEFFREPESWELCRTGRTATYTLWNNAELLAYALIGKGKDLRGVCHELIGINNETTNMLATMLPKGTVLLLNPKTMKNIPGHQHASRGILALAKNPPQVDWISGLESC